jgi:hypothetical protein
MTCELGMMILKLKIQLLLRVSQNHEPFLSSNPGGGGVAYASGLYRNVLWSSMYRTECLYNSICMEVDGETP